MGCPTLAFKASAFVRSANPPLAQSYACDRGASSRVSVGTVDTSTPLRSLPTAARTRWRVQGALLGALLAVVVALAPTIVLAVLLESAAAALVPLVLVGLGIAGGLLWANRRYARFGYLLTEEVVRVRDGVVFHSDAIAPLYRVQHVDINRGPLQLSFGLATLTIHTAAPAADVRLPDLHADDAERVRDDILAASRRAAEELGVADIDAV